MKIKVLYFKYSEICPECRCKDISTIDLSLTELEYCPYYLKGIFCNHCKNIYLNTLDIQDIQDRVDILKKFIHDIDGDLASYVRKRFGADES